MEYLTYEGNVHEGKVGYLTPRCKFLSLMHTVVTSNPRYCQKMSCHAHQRVDGPWDLQRATVLQLLKRVTKVHSKVRFWTLIVTKRKSCFFHNLFVLQEYINHESFVTCINNIIELIPHQFHEMQKIFFFCIEEL